MKKEKIWKFFKPSTWKIVITLMVAVVFHFYILSSIKIVEYSFDTGSDLKITPITNMPYSYILLIFSAVFFYLLLSFIELIINKLREKS